MIFKSDKNVFWQALVIVIILFSFGVYFGHLLENWRTNNIIDFYAKSELNLLDLNIQNKIYSLKTIDCNNSIKENINFGNDIYKEALLLVKYENAQRITDNIKLQHKKYDLLRNLFWINSIEIKHKCNAAYHNIVYLYHYNNPNIEKMAKQDVFYNLLNELKEKYQNEIMLIPIAGDNDLASINLMMDLYNVSVSELPVILIDEKIKLTGVETLEQVEGAINGARSL